MLLSNFLNNPQRKHPWFNNIVFKPQFYQNVLEDNNKFDEVLLSPEERDEFINELLKINPNIEIKL